MSWMENLWTKVYGESVNDLVLIRNLKVPNLDGRDSLFTADECYVELYLESLRLEKARRFATKFNGVVYSFQSLARQGDGTSTIAAISKPNELAELDEKSIGRVITVSKKMMGAIPWCGGSLHIELGLFSVKSGNLLSPVLNLVTDVSKVAGTSFVGSISPFVPLIRKGMDVLAGQPEDVSLEVAIDTDLELLKTEAFAIVAANKDSFDTSKVSVDASDSKLLFEGRPLNAAYCVFSVRQVDSKADYGDVPELKEKYAALMAAIRSGKQQDAAEAMVAFRLAAMSSPDLILKDAQLLVKKVGERVKAAFPSGPTSGVLSGAPPSVADTREPSEGDLYSINLYT